MSGYKYNWWQKIFLKQPTKGQDTPKEDRRKGGHIEGFRGWIMAGSGGVRDQAAARAARMVRYSRQTSATTSASKAVSTRSGIEPVSIHWWI